MIKNDQKSDNVCTGRITMRSRKIASRQERGSEHGAPGTARRSVLTGGALGLAAVAGSALGGTEPANAATTGPIWISPSGGDDTAAIQAIVKSAGGGILGLASGQFNITSVAVFAQTTDGVAGGFGWSIIGCGSATVVNVTGAGSGFSVHRTAGYGAQFGLPAQHTTVFMRNFVIDGTNASPGAIGVDIGDGWGYDIDLTIVNFNQPGSIGLRLNNQVFWTEKGRFTAQLMNNDTAAVIDSVGGDISHEYNFFDFNIFSNTNQQGLVIAGGVNAAGCTLKLHGNMAKSDSGNSGPTGNIAALTLTGTGTRLFNSEIIMKVEGNTGGSGTGPFPYGIFYSDSSNAIKNCNGTIAHSLTNSNINGGEFSFRGLIFADPNLSNIYTTATAGQTSSQPPAMPSSGTALQNYGPDQMVHVSGGTVTGIPINTVPTTLTSGNFFIPAGGSIAVSYTGTPAPTWTWVPASFSSA
jgi:hypothetical protein